MRGEVLAWEPPPLLSFTWGDRSEVTFTLEQVGEQVHLARLEAEYAERIPE